MNLSEALSACSADSNLKMVYLPTIQLERSVYEALNKKLQGAGGKWNRGKKGFSFDHDPSELLAQIQEGGSINLKKEYQYFPTPDSVANKMAEFVKEKWFAGAKVLEPSAGQGALVKALQRKVPDIPSIDCCEISPYNKPILAMVKGVNIIGEDFMNLEGADKYDFIIANPPFTKNQDIKHTTHAYGLLRRGGMLVTLVSQHYTFANDSASNAFREFVDENSIHQEDIKEGEFKESGTMVRTKLLVLIKE